MRKSNSLIFALIIIFMMSFSQLLFSLSEWIEYDSKLYYVPLLEKIFEPPAPGCYEILEVDETTEEMIVEIDGVLYVLVCE